MLTKLTGCRTSISKTCDIRSGAIDGPQRHNLNKLGNGSRDDATNIISKLYFEGLVVSDKNIFFMFSIYKHKHLTHWKGHFSPKGHNLINSSDIVE